MTGYRPKVTRDAHRCSDTATMIKNMIRYTSSNRKIAQYCGVTEEYVAHIRAPLPSTEDCNKRSRSRHIVGTVITAEAEKGSGEYIAYRIRSRRDDAKMVAALERAGA